MRPSPVFLRAVDLFILSTRLYVMETKQSNQKEKFKPRIQTFTSAASYLCAFYDYRKAIESRFSYDLWAQEIGFKSKSTLRSICHGQRNVSLQFVELFSHKEKFSSQEIEYFLLLAKIHNTDNISLKKIYLDKIAEQMDLSHKKTEVKQSLQFLTDPVLSKIQLLISFEDFVASESNLKKLLGLDILKVRRALRLLEELNLTESYFTEDKKEKMWRSRAKYFSVSGEMHREAMNIFHLQTLQEAQQAVKMTTMSKKFKSLFFSLSENDFKDLEDTLSLFSNKLKVKYGNNFIKKKKLYKINFQVYPVTEECD
jgi:uncharacterized protein (TIGR02147 family)